MALEDLSKKDLVELARKLDQANKEMSIKVDKIKANADELPYEAVAVVSADDKHYSVKIKFDLDSDVAVVTEKFAYERNMKHMAEYHAKLAFGVMSRITNIKKENK